MTLLRAVLKVASKDRQVRRMLINEIRKTAEGEGEEAPKSKGKGRSGPPPGFDEYKKIVWQDGKKKVPNPNPKGREKDVTFNTAMKDKNFMKKIMKDFQKWLKQKKKDESSGPKKRRIRSPEEIAKSGKPLMEKSKSIMKDIKSEFSKDPPDKKKLKELGKQYGKLTKKVYDLSHETAKAISRDQMLDSTEDNEKELKSLQDLGKSLMDIHDKIDDMVWDAPPKVHQEFWESWEEGGGQSEKSIKRMRENFHYVRNF